MNYSFLRRWQKIFNWDQKESQPHFLKIWDNWSWLYHYHCHKDTPPFYPCTLGFRLACLDEEFLLLQFWVDGDLPVKCPFAVWSHLQLEVFWWWGSLCVQGHYRGTHCAKLSFFVQKFKNVSFSFFQYFLIIFGIFTVLINWTKFLHLAQCVANCHTRISEMSWVELHCHHHFQNGMHLGY